MRSYVRNTHFALKDFTGPVIFLCEVTPEIGNAYLRRQCRGLARQ